MLLFYVRHGDPVYDPDSLTPLGQRQAEAAARRLALHGIDEIYASSSNRAIQTARPTAELTHNEIHILDWCNESHAWAQMTVRSPDGKKDWCWRDPACRRLFLSEETRRLGMAWYRQSAFADTAFGAGMERVQAETDLFLAGLGYEHDRAGACYRAMAPNEKRIALFAHQGFGFCFLSAVLDIPYPWLTLHTDLGHSSITVIEFCEDGDGVVIPQMLQMSGDAHLYRDGLPMRYQNRIDI